MLTRDRDDDDARSVGRGPGNDRQGSDQQSAGLRPRSSPGRSRSRWYQNAIASVGTCLHATSTCRVGSSAKSSAIVVANTPCVAPNRARWPPSALFEWSPVVISATPRSRVRPAQKRPPPPPRAGPGRDRPGARLPRVRRRTLTREGRRLLERHRDGDQVRRQTFWDGLKREREREHDLQVYRAYERAARPPGRARRPRRPGRARPRAQARLSGAGCTSAIATATTTTATRSDPGGDSRMGPRARPAVLR